MRKSFMIRLLQFENKAASQAVDYSPVTSIFRLISSFFDAFLSHKRLVSRRLRRKQGLIKCGARNSECGMAERGQIRTVGHDKTQLNTMVADNIFLFFEQAKPAPM
jgi:hypothetical protein